MSALQPTGPLISIGGALLYTVGPSAQRLSYSSEGRFPGHATQGGMAYQATGAGDERMTIEVLTFPHVLGGLDSVDILKTLHRSQMIAPFIRLHGFYLGKATGMVVVETFDFDEEKLHPVTGIGRRVEATLGLLFMPASQYLQSAGRIATLGGIIG